MWRLRADNQKFIKILFSRMLMPPSPDEFLTRCDLLAFAMNGGTPGKRAMKYPTEFTSHPRTYACGKGREIYRGACYPLDPLGLCPHLSKTDAFALTYKRSRIGKLPWKVSDLEEAAHTRLKAQLGAYSQTSDNG